MPSNDKKTPSLWQMIHSILAAMLGVQTSKAHQRDFTHGKPWVFILLGIVAVTLFVLLLFAVVNFVISSTKVV